MTPLEQLPLEDQTASNETPSTKAGDSQAPEAPSPTTQPPPERCAGGRTSARSPGTAKEVRAGARPRRPSKKGPKVSKAPTATVNLVMLTSRISDVDGRFVARRRVAQAVGGRAEDLIERGLARRATQPEIEAAARVGPIVRLG